MTAAKSLPLESAAAQAQRVGHSAMRIGGVGPRPARHGIEELVEGLLFGHVSPSAATVAHAPVLLKEGARCPMEGHVEVPPEGFAESAEITLIDREDYPPSAADSDQVREAAQLLAKAERPLIVAGGGAVLGDATEELRQLAELLQAPVVMTSSAMPLPSTVS